LSSIRAASSRAEMRRDFQSMKEFYKDSESAG